MLRIVFGLPLRLGIWVRPEVAAVSWNCSSTHGHLSLLRVGFVADLAACGLPNLPRLSVV